MPDSDDFESGGETPLLLRPAATPPPGDGRKSKKGTPFIAGSPKPSTEGGGGVGLLGHYQLDPAHRLKVCLDMAQRAFEEYHIACATADVFSPADMPDGTDTNDLLNRIEAMRRDIRTTYNRWQEYTHHAKDAEQEVRKAKLEQPLSGDWALKFQEIRDRLQQEYSGLGPQYDLLCDNLASVSVRIRQLEESGRDYDSGEYVELMKLYVTLTNQLQKYTEAMKSESINKQTQDVALRLVGIFERHFGQAYPVEWRACVTEVKMLAASVGQDAA